MSSRELLLAIDNGSQSLRALVFDPAGRLLACARVPLPPGKAPRPGWAEQEPAVFWDALCAACQALWREHGVDPAAIAAVALTTQRASVVCLDRAGQPLRPAILWSDRRTTAGLPPVGGIWGQLFKIAGLRCTIAYLQANAESNWLRTHEPDIWRRTHRFLLLSGYLNYRLTGSFVDATGSQVGYLPFDYKNKRWAAARDWRWAALGVAPEQLPELVATGTELGRICASAAAATGLPAGLTVIATAADKACEVLGAGALASDTACLSLGTAATVNVTSTRYIEPQLFIPPYPAAVPDRYNLEVQIFRGYWMVTWFLQEFGLEERMKVASLPGSCAEDHLEELIAAVPPGCEGLMLQPYWSPGLKQPGPEARGAMIGFSDAHGRAHLLRAILEGLAYSLREGLERIERRTRVPITALRVAGGGSRSAAAMQLTADIFGRPATRPETREASGLGAAMIAAVSLGLHADFPAAVAAMTRAGDIFDPIPANRRHYDRIYRTLYLKMYRRLKPFYQRMQDLFA